jgi:hypothetical protein
MDINRKKKTLKTIDINSEESRSIDTELEEDEEDSLADFFEGNARLFD